MIVPENPAGQLAFIPSIKRQTPIPQERWFKFIIGKVNMSQKRIDENQTKTKKTPDDSIH
jgi:hypothetical protein